MIDTANYFPRLARKDYHLAIDVATGGLDDPDQKFYENYACGAERNYTGYCDPETDRLIDAQSIEADPDKRRQLVWQIERRLADDASRPVLLYSRFASCKQPRLKDLVTMTNSRFNGWRMKMCGSTNRPGRFAARFKAATQASIPGGGNWDDGGQPSKSA